MKRQWRFRPWSHWITVALFFAVMVQNSGCAHTSRSELSVLELANDQVPMPSSQDLVWTPHPCGDRPGAPFRKYEAFAFDPAQKAIFAKNLKTGSHNIISSSVTGVEEFFQVTGIRAFCENAAAQNHGKPQRRQSKNTNDFNPTDEDRSFVAPITEDVSLFYGEVQASISSKQSGDVKSAAFTETLTRFMSLPHIQEKGKADKTVEECPADLPAEQICVRQRLFDYNKVRQVMFGQVDLRQNSETNDYEVYDYYCQKWRGKADFSVVGAKETDRPGPDRIVHSSVVNVEHSWPQSKFTGEKGSPLNLLQKTDLHHIFPTDTQVNQLRGNYEFAEVEAETSAPMKCGDGKLGTAVIPTTVADMSGSSPMHFEPPKNHKGNVARALFYFAVRYQAKMSSLQEYYLRKWHSEDPPDNFERSRHEKVYRVTGTRNPFIDHPDWVELIPSFSK